jgi:hypothetical protein
LAEEARVYVRSSDGALRQGELLSSLVEVRRVLQAVSQELQIDLVNHPYAIVISQDCDLEQDFFARTRPAEIAKPEDKLLPGVLFCEVITATELRGRLADGQIWKQIIQNKNERYHYLREIQREFDLLDEGIPELGIDFKRYFTVPTGDIYSQIGAAGRRRSHLQSPYLEHLSVRFANYLSRVALPEEHFVRKS